MWVGWEPWSWELSLYSTIVYCLRNQYKIISPRLDILFALGSVIYRLSSVISALFWAYVLPYSCFVELLISASVTFRCSKWHYFTISGITVRIFRERWRKRQCHTYQRKNLHTTIEREHYCYPSLIGGAELQSQAILFYLQQWFANGNIMLSDGNWDEQ